MLASAPVAVDAITIPQKLAMIDTNLRTNAFRAQQYTIQIE